MPKCHSTNDIATDLLGNSSLLEGTIIITDQQTKGKGQRGNEWFSEANKNITCSVILLPTTLNIQRQFYLNMMVSLAIIDFLSEYIAGELKIKWPNDIYYKHQKIGGILIENTLKGSNLVSSIIGIGLNINQNQFKDSLNATSLALITEKQFELKKVLPQLMINLEKRYMQLKANQFELLKSEYLTQLFWYKCRGKFKTDHLFHGEIVDIDEGGKLMIASNGNITKYDLKEIRHIIT